MDQAMIDALESGVVVSIISYIVVFVVLAVIYLVFSQLPNLIKLMNRPGAKKRAAKAAIGVKVDDFTGAEAAAIAYALYLYANEQHDEESHVITIKNISRRYSPWSSKIYGVRGLFQK